MTNMFIFGKTVTKEYLPNGITFVHNYNPEQPLVTVIIFLKMGSIYEPTKLSGISELLQSVIIKGTKNRTAKQIVEEVESLGGGISSDSDTDFATISISIGSQHYEKAVELLYDIFTNPTFPEDEIRKEKINIIAGILARKDRIFNVAIDKLMLNLYGKDHPYGRLPEKTAKVVKKINRKELILWWRKFYGIDKNQNNIVIVVSGDVDFDNAKNLLLKYFGSVPQIKLPPVQDIKLPSKNKYIKHKTHFKQAYLMYGFVSPAIKNERIKDYLSLKLLNLYLGGGMSGKLFEILREQHSLCYETNCFYPTKYLDSHFVIYLGLDHNRINLARNKIDEIILQLKNGEIFNEQDLHEVKTKFRGRYILDHQTNSRQAWYLGFWEIIGMGCEYDSKYLEDIQNVSIEDIRSTISKIFFVNQPTIVELVPKRN